VHLLGQTVDAYGRDLPRDERPSLASLIRALDGVDGLARTRLITLHPSYIDGELAAAMAESPKFMRFLPVPLQSGSDRVLKAMKRGYTMDLYRRRIALLKDAMPDLELISDWIVGFPGERDEDFAASEAAMREIGFLQSYVFQYSPRPGTAAFEIEDDVPREVKAARNHRLLALQKEIARERTPRMVGRRSRLLLEKQADGAVDAAAQWLGRIHNGHYARVPDRPGCAEGAALEVHLEGWNGRYLLAASLSEPVCGLPSEAVLQAVAAGASHSTAAEHRPPSDGFAV
jgi:tRNA-2-methylthio-N6-dimethylallyladenosine synthase